MLEQPINMKRTILVAVSTNRIGLETAKMLVSQGRHVLSLLLHGRNPSKLEGEKKRPLHCKVRRALKTTWPICRALPMSRHLRKR